MSKLPAVWMKEAAETQEGRTLGAAFSKTLLI